MIQDAFAMPGTNAALNPGLARAFAFWSGRTRPTCPKGATRWTEERVFAVVARGAGRDRAGALLEVHDRYIDVQCILKGADRMGWKPRRDCVRPRAPSTPGAPWAFSPPPPPPGWPPAPGSSPSSSPTTRTCP